VQELPDGYFIVVDNVYTLSTTLLTLYSGKDKQNSSKDAYNFFLSQLCIRWITCIQMAIFKKSKEGKFWCTTLIIEAAFHLQKFCIDMHDSSIVGIGNFDPETFCPSYVEYLDPLGNNATLKSKRHAVHQAILQKIKSDGQR
jgi:hypothetical protein